MRHVLLLCGLAVAFLVRPGVVGAQGASEPPAVLKVDPPSWWPGSSVNPVRLLVRGRGLEGARVEALEASGLGIGLVRVNAAGSYLFVDVVIDPDAIPGPRSLRVRTAGGSVDLPFELVAPLAPGGRFQGLSSDDVLYLVMPDRFANGDPSNDDPAKAPGLHDRARPRYYHGGDLRGIADHLPYLKDLGVTALWLNPWYDNSDRLNQHETYDGQAITDYHGYGAVDFYAVDEHLGTLADLRALVDRAHALGLKVVQDQVANHTGPDHPWVRDEPTPTWFHGTEASHLANTWQTWTLQDPHATPAMRKATLEGWFIDILPDLNQEDPEVARYLVQNALWWVGVTGIDAIRQDTLPYVSRAFWRDWSSAIRREYPGLTEVGELFDGDPTLVSFYQGGGAGFDGIDTGIPSLFDFPLYFPLREAFARGGSLREVAKALARDHLYPDPSSLVTFLGLHDVPRFMSEPGASLASLRAALTFLLTARGIPLVYYGDEIGMPGGGDPDNRRDFPGGWAGDPRNAFEASGRTPDEQQVFAHVQKLLRIRRDWPVLRHGRMRELAVDERTWAYSRVAEGACLVVAFNLGSGPASFEAPAAGLGLDDGERLEDLLRYGGTAVVEMGRLRLNLPGLSSALFAPSSRAPISR
jgi:glycosidase